MQWKLQAFKVDDQHFNVGAPIVVFIDFTTSLELSIKEKDNFTSNKHATVQSFKEVDYDSINVNIKRETKTFLVIVTNRIPLDTLPYLKQT